MDPRKPAKRTLFDDLQEHQGFLQRIARQLVGEDGADDLVQDAWVAALERPAESVASPRGWLVRVLSNRRASNLRGQERRRARERSAAREEALPDVADVQVRLELVQRVAAAVEALPDTYREVVFLSAYKDCKPQEIARRLGVPVQTVYTRLRRGRALLRERLDETYDGDRSAWSRALLPFAGPGPWIAASTPSTPPAATPNASARRITEAASDPLLLPLLAMSTKLLVAVGIVAAAALTVWLAWPDRSVRDASAGTTDLVGAAPPGDGVETDADPAVEAPLADPVSTPDRAAVVEPVELAPAPGSGALLVRATFASDGSAVAGAFGRLEREDDASLDARAFVLDEEGTLELSDLAPGAWRLALTGRGTWRLALSEGEVRTLDLLVPEGITVRGRVLSPDEEPVAGAEVLLHRFEGDERQPLVRTDADGTYELRDLAPWRQSGPWTEITARADGYTSAEVFDVTGDVPSTREVDFRLTGTSGRVRGTVRSSDGATVAGARLHFPAHDQRSGEFANAEGILLSPAESVTLTTDADGAFASREVALGLHGVRVVADGHPETHVQIEVFATEREPREITLAAGGHVEGTLVDEDDRPVPDHSIRAKSRSERNYRYASTDADGRFAFRGLPSGSVKLTWNGGPDSVGSTVEVRTGRTESVVLRLQARTSVAGTLTDADGTPLTAHWVCIVEPDQPGLWVRQARTDEAGRFTLDGVPDGAKAIEVRTPSPFEHPPLLFVPWPEGPEPFELVVPDAQLPTGSVEFVVVDEAGAPIPGAECWLGHAELNWGKQFFTDEAGGGRFEGLVAGSYRLRVASATLVEAEPPVFEIAAEDALDLGTLVLRAGGMLDLTLTCSDPAVEEVFAYGELVSMDAGPNVSLSSANGRIQTGLLPPGEYLVRLSGHTLARKELRVRIEAGETTRRALELDPGTYRAFQFVPPLPEGELPELEVYDPDGALFESMRTLSNEQATVFGMWAGSWRVVVRGSDGLSGEATIPVDELGFPTEWIEIERD